MGSRSGDDGVTPPTTTDWSYADRLNHLQNKWWKGVLHVQAPFKAHIRHLGLGRTLDVGCGIGRNLHYLTTGSVGVDHNPFSIETARAAGLDAYATDKFFAHPIVSAPHRVVFITPQERGYASDGTHVYFADFTELARLSATLGLEHAKAYSFPFPRFAGKAFSYNEFVLVSRVPAR